MVFLGGKNYWEYNVLKHGYNYRLSDLNCALGLSQLNKIGLFLQMRKRIYLRYVNSLKNFNLNLIIPNYSKNIYSAFHLFFINLNFKSLKNKDHFMKYLVRNKILSQQHYIPIYKFDVYKEKTFFQEQKNFMKIQFQISIFVDLKLAQQKSYKSYKKLFKTLTN